MGGKTPREALNNFVAPLQRAVACVSDRVFVRSHASHEPGRVHAVAVPKTGFATLRGDSRLLLSVALEYDLVEVDDPDRGPWKVRTRQYRYHVVTSDFAEVVLFHWLPLGQCSTDAPHLHIGLSQLTRDAVITRKTHMPSGRVALESVIETLITEFNVVPLRSDWQNVINEGREKFERWRTWG